MGCVVTRGVEQPGQEQWPHHAVVLAERVFEPQHGLVGEAEPAERLGGGEAVGDALVQAAVAEEILDPAAQALAVREAPDRALARGQGGGELVEAVDAGHLLDEVGLALDVRVAPWRDGPSGMPGASLRLAGGERFHLLLEPEPFQDLGHARRRDALPQ